VRQTVLKQNPQYAPQQDIYPLSQATLHDTVTLTGRGVHSNQPVCVTIHPADADHGIVFIRSDLERDDTLEGARISASYKNVSSTQNCTTLGDPIDGISTVEHLMAAFFALGISNALVMVDGAEMPILDGSSSAYLATFDEVGVRAQTMPQRFIEVLRPVQVKGKNSSITLLPRSRAHKNTPPLRIDMEIEFPSSVVGHQRRVVDVTPEIFQTDISKARTFGFMKDVEALWKRGLALGASLENTVAIGEHAVVNPEGLRYSDECVRHKILDAIGDLALAGYPLIAEYQGYCSGHALNVAVLVELFSDPRNYRFVDAYPRPATQSRKSVGSSLSYVSAANFAPDKN
jgi:UDP-3-O-[3-hydroxymyristoyl] N-acetylglucosamine deacetylase